MKCLVSLYAGAFLQFTTGRIGWSSLCILISPLIEGAEGFMFVYFHLESFGIRVVLSFVVCFVECIGWACGGSAEVVVKYEILYFGLVLMCGYYDYAFTLVCPCYHGIVVL